MPGTKVERAATRDARAHTQVCKTTVSLEDPGQPVWAELANDVVVNEKTVRV